MSQLAINGLLFLSAYFGLGAIGIYFLVKKCNEAHAKRLIQEQKDWARIDALIAECERARDPIA